MSHYDRRSGIYVAEKYLMRKAKRMDRALERVAVLFVVLASIAVLILARRMG